MDNVIEKAQKVASGILRAIPMAPVSKHIATWVDDVDIREFQTYHDVGVGLEVTEDGKHIVARKRPKSSSWNLVGFGDEIVAIGDRSVEGMPVEKVEGMLRGPLGSSVKVEIRSLWEGVRVGAATVTVSLQRTRAACGVGMMLDYRMGVIIISDVVQDSPADESGQVSIGDELVSIDGKIVAGMALCDVQDLTSGDAGTTSTFKLCSMKGGSTWSVELSMDVPAWAVAPGSAPSAVGAASSAAPSLSWGSSLFPATPPGSPPIHRNAAASRPPGRRGSQGERELLDPPSAFEKGDKNFTRTASDEARFKARIQSKGGLIGDQIVQLLHESSDSSLGGASAQGGLAASTFTLSPEDDDTSPIMAVSSGISRRKSDGKSAQNSKNKDVWARASSAGEASPSATTLVVNLGNSLSSSPRTPSRASKQAADAMRSRSPGKSSPGRNSPAAAGGASRGPLRGPFANSPFVESAADKSASQGDEGGAKVKESLAAPAAVSPRISSPPLKISRPPPPLSAISHLSKSMPSARAVDNPEQKRKLQDEIHRLQEILHKFKSVKANEDEEADSNDKDSMASIEVATMIEMRTMKRKLTESLAALGISNTGDRRVSSPTVSPTHSPKKSPLNSPTKKRSQASGGRLMKIESAISTDAGPSNGTREGDRPGPMTNSLPARRVSGDMRMAPPLMSLSAFDKRNQGVGSEEESYISSEAAMSMSDMSKMGTEAQGKPPTSPEKSGRRSPAGVRSPLLTALKSLVSGNPAPMKSPGARASAHGRALSSESSDSDSTPGRSSTLNDPGKLSRLESPISGVVSQDSRRAASGGRTIESPMMLTSPSSVSAVTQWRESPKRSQGGAARGSKKSNGPGKESPLSVGSKIRRPGF